MFFWAYCIYHRYIYISRPPPRGTDGQMYRLSIERIVSIVVDPSSLGGGEQTGEGQTDKQADRQMDNLILI